MATDATTSLWDRCAQHVRAQVSEATWNTCFAAAVPMQISDQRLVLGVPNSLVKQRIEERFLSLLRTILTELSGHGFEVVLEINDDPGFHGGLFGSGLPAATGLLVDTTDRTDSASDTSVGGPLSSSPVPAPVLDTLPRTGPMPFGTGNPSGDTLVLNPRYTFEDFVIGASNRFAQAAALSVAETPARSYNPLFIYGESGLGKTHLLQAIAHYVRHNYPNSRVRYVSTETFVNEFVDAIRTNTSASFKRRYRDDCDVLLIDDIQFMEGKEGTQEEFFHTFNFLHQSGRQIVISSDRPPKSIATLEDRLRSRFEWGLITDVQPPELETRLAILRKKAERERVSVPDEVMNFIGTHIKDNIRELEGALNRVCAFAGLERVPLDLATAQKVLADQLSGSEPRPITAKVILNATSTMFGFGIPELVGQSRRRPLVTARQIAMYVFRELTDFSYPMIGREFGGRDHTTVIHAVEKISEQMKERRAIYEQVTELIRVVRSGG
jgi:chromosomal replication initiator protein